MQNSEFVWGKVSSLLFISFFALFSQGCGKKFQSHSPSASNGLIGPQSSSTTTSSTTTTTQGSVSTSSTTTTTLRLVTTTSTTTTVTATSSSTTVTMTTTTTTTTQPTSLITPEVGGTNYVSYDLGPNPSNPDFSEVSFSIIHYDLNPMAVRNQLQGMYNSGQRKIALMLWHVPSNQIPEVYPSDEFPVGVSCNDNNNHAVCLNNGRMNPRYENNLRLLLQDIESVGFDTVHIRFGQQFRSHPFYLHEFLEDRQARGLLPQFAGGPEAYKNFVFEKIKQDNWTFIRSVKTIVRQMNLEPDVFWDLGVELMGHPFSVRSRVRQYLVDMLELYKQSYGTEDSIGFSFNLGSFFPGGAGAISSRQAFDDAFRVFNEAEFPPAALGIDVYYDRRQTLSAFAQSKATFGWETNYPVIFLETFYNDSAVAQDTLFARNTLNLNVRYILQWPLTSNAAAGAHLNIVAPTQFANYLRP